MKTLVQANVGRRLVAALMDGIFFVVLWLVMAMYIFQPIANSAFSYTSNMSLGYQYQIASHIYLYVQADASGEYHPIEVKDYSEKIDTSLDSNIEACYSLTFDSYETYLEHVRYFYCSYLTNVDIEMPTNTATKTYDAIADHFVSPEWNDPVVISDGSSVLPKDLYTTYWFNVSVLHLPTIDQGITTSDNCSFEYAVVDGVIQYETIGLKKESVSNEDAITFCKNALAVASKELYYANYYQSLMNDIKGAQIFIAIVPYVIDFGLIYFLFPLIFKNGETLGKKTMHIALVNSKGFKVSKPQVLLRQFVFLAEVSLSLFIVGFGTTSIATLGVGIVIMLIVTLVNKKNKAPHDYAAATYMIDARKSVWFASQKEEDIAEQKLEEKITKYRSAKPDTKHIIQVEGQIVDENIKREVEEAKKEKNNSVDDTNKKSE